MILPDTTRVAAVFDRREDADAARDDLLGNGFSEEEIRLADRSESIAGREEQSGFWTQFREMLGHEQADKYSDVARHSAAVVSVDARGEDRADEAAGILDRHHPVDLDARWNEGQRGGQSQVKESEYQAGRQSPPQGTAEGRKRDEETIPIAEEKLSVGKRKVQGGGVRIYSHVKETPVEQDVTLRDEEVDVERRAVDRPAGPEAFQERTVEATESHEEPVVHKEARVKEEITIERHGEEHTETISDTVRETEVEFDELEQDFRKHYDEKYARSGEEYDAYSPAYQYGRELGENAGTSNWSDVEPKAREDFERRNPGSWDRYGEAVRHGFERATHDR